MHNLAATLHKTVGELLDTMTPAEYLSWSVYFEDREVQRERAENRAKGIVDFSDPEATAQLIGMVGSGGGAKAPKRPRGGA